MLYYSDTVNTAVLCGLGCSQTTYSVVPVPFTAFPSGIGLSWIGSGFLRFCMMILSDRLLRNQDPVDKSNTTALPRERYLIRHTHTHTHPYLFFLPHTRARENSVECNPRVKVKSSLEACQCIDDSVTNSVHTNAWI